MSSVTPSKPTGGTYHKGCGSAVLALLLCPGLCLFLYWQKMVMPYELTHRYARELSPVIAQFEATEGSLETQLHPKSILTVATGEYAERFQRISTALGCSGCDRFWVTISAQTGGVCVLEYSPWHSVVRATRQTTGYYVDIETYEPLSDPLSRGGERSTYHLVKENGVWKVARITDYMPANKGQADLFRVLDENLDELGCQW